MSAPTKGDSFADRLFHAFSEKRINECFQRMMWNKGLIDLLTDEARDELLSRCISSHKVSRQYAAQSRRIYRERMEKKNVV